MEQKTFQDGSRKLFKMEELLAQEVLEQLRIRCHTTKIKPNKT
jgi:hypothetical protein